MVSLQFLLWQATAGEPLLLRRWASGLCCHGIATLRLVCPKPRGLQEHSGSSLTPWVQGAGREGVVPMAKHSCTTQRLNSSGEENTAQPVSFALTSTVIYIFPPRFPSAPAHPS